MGVSDPDEDRHLATIDRLTRERDHARAELRRVYDELDWRDEKIRVLERVIERLGSNHDADRPG